MFPCDYHILYKDVLSGAVKKHEMDILNQLVE